MTIKAFKNRGLLLAVVFILSLFLSGVSEAGKKEEYKLQRAKKRRERIRAIKKNLNGTTWGITLKPSVTQKRKRSIKDIVTFQNGKIGSKVMVSEGFSPSNFSIRIKREKNVIWETMQTSEKKGLAFWKGEIEDGIMRGVLSWHVDEKTIKDYTFVSEKQEVALIPKEEEISEMKEPEEPKQEPPKIIEEPLKEKKEEVKPQEAEKKEPESKKETDKGGKKKKERRKWWFW